MLAAVKGIYQNGQLILTEKVPFTGPVTVIVTFMEESKKTTIPSKIDLAQFSFAQSREILKEVNSSLSDALIEERRSAL